MKIIQKKKESLPKRSRVLAAVFCVILMALTAVGCGKIEEPIPVDLSSGNIVELQDGADRESENDPEEAAAGDSDSEDVSDGAAEISADENEQQTEEAQPQSVGSAELDGDVRSIGADSFVVARAETWAEGDSQFMVSAVTGYEDEASLITVRVNQNCVWEFKTVKNGGVNPEDISTREGSFADLKEDIMINSKGSWQDDGSFLADSIVMMIFV